MACMVTSPRAHSPKGVARRSLMQHHSYRLVKGAHNDRMIGLRYLKMALALVFRDAEEYVERAQGEGVQGTEDLAVFDVNLGSRVSRYAYLEALTGEAPRLFAAREHLGLRKLTAVRLLETVVLLLMAVFVIPVTWFHPRRGSVGLHLLEVVECARFFEILSVHGIRKLYHFSAYSKDANFIASFLQRQGIYVHKVPSSNPIKNFYREVVADGFSLTAPYQKNELEDLKSGYFVTDVVEWPVFNFQNLRPLIPTLKTPPKQTLGLVSSGTWRRQERGDMALGIGDQESELRLLEFLRGYLKARPELTLTVFMHPIERDTQARVEQARAHYQAFFEGTVVHLSDPDLPTNQQFDRVDTSIAAYSSANLERLYMGLKTLYAPLAIRSDFYAGGSLERIAAFDASDLEALIDRNLPLGQEEFFEVNQVWDTHHSYFSTAPTQPEPTTPGQQPH